MYVSLRILDEDIPELDKLILLQLYNASYHSSISDQSLLPIIVSANDDSGGILRFSDSSLSLFISEDIMPTIQECGVRVIASRILHEICFLVGELAITLNARLGTKSNLLIEQVCY